MAKKKDKKSNGRATGERGELIVRELLIRLGLQPRKDDPDDGYDLNVEVPGEGALPDRRFLGQTKTKPQHPERKDGTWRVAVRASAVARYRRSRYPVILFAVDLRSGEVRWLDLMKAMSKLKTNTFSLDPTCQLNESALEALLHQIARTEADLDEQYVSIPDVISRREQRLRNSTGDFSVSISATAQGETMHIRSEKPVRLTFEVTSSNDHRALAAAIGFGTSATITPAKVTVTEPAFLKDAAFNGSLTITPARNKGHFRLRALGSGEDATLDLDGESTFGTAGGELALSDPDCPLQFRARITWEPFDCDMKLQLQPQVWHGRALKYLPYLRPLRKLLDRIQNNVPIQFEHLRDGEYHRLFSGKMGDIDRDFISDQFDLYGDFESLSLICRHYGLDTRWQNDASFTSGQAASWRMLARILENGSAETGIGPLEFHSDEGTEHLLEMSPCTGEWVVHSPLEIVFERCTIKTVPIEYRLRGDLVERTDADSADVGPRIRVMSVQCSGASRSIGGRDVEYFG